VIDPSPAAVVVVSLVALALGYRTYARWLERKVFRVREDEPVPSRERPDGIDFVPTRREVLWGHHFASVAGAAPILGPAMAIVWGWVPALLWIVFGVIFMGAAHDFGALVLSMRHGGRSVGALTERFIGPRSRLLFLIIIFFLIWLVGAVFAFSIARLFVSFPASILPVNAEIVVAMALGWWSYRRGGGLLVPSIVILVGLYALIVATSTGAIPVPGAGSVLLDVDFWLVALMAYAFVASVMPVWLLVQPRDLVNSHQLLVGLGALYVGFFVLRPEFAAPAIGPLDALPALFPLLMVTIACGAISGFHGLVSSGTTSKQIAAPLDARPIGYGAMLGEAALAILATVAVAAGVMGPGARHVTVWAHVHEEALVRGRVFDVALALQGFVQGAAGFLAGIGIPPAVAASIIAVLVISFAATSLDTAMRIQRFVLAEIGQIYGVKPLQNRWIGSAIASGSVLALIWADKKHGAQSLWPVFGATNQVLAAFTLATIALYLRTLGRRSIAYAAPAVVVLAITFSAMAIQVHRDIGRGKWGVAGVGAVIAVLSLWVALEAALAWRRGGPGAGAGTDRSTGGAEGAAP
jgi:carbon starvation protein